MGDHAGILGAVVFCFYFTWVLPHARKCASNIILFRLKVRSLNIPLTSAMDLVTLPDRTCRQECPLPIHFHRRRNAWPESAHLFHSKVRSLNIFPSRLSWMREHWSIAQTLVQGRLPKDETVLLLHYKTAVFRHGYCSITKFMTNAISEFKSSRTMSRDDLGRGLRSRSEASDYCCRRKRPLYWTDGLSMSRRHPLQIDGESELGSQGRRGLFKVAKDVGVKETPS